MHMLLCFKPAREGPTQVCTSAERTFLDGLIAAFKAGPHTSDDRSLIRLPLAREDPMLHAAVKVPLIDSASRACDLMASRAVELKPMLTTDPFLGPDAGWMALFALEHGSIVRRLSWSPADRTYG